MKKNRFLISAINDEIAPNFYEQIRILNNNSIKFIELRKINGKYLFELLYEELYNIKLILERFKINVSLIDSPIGKKQLSSIEKYIEIAKMFNCDKIRIFSNCDLEVLNRVAFQNNITLLLENEPKTYGSDPKYCLDAIQKHSNIQLLFDIENYHVCGFNVFETYEMLKTNIVYIHLRDRIDNQYVVPGYGNLEINRFLSLLKSDCYEYYVSLEMHLSMNNKEDKLKLSFEEGYKSFISKINGGVK